MGLELLREPATFDALLAAHREPTVDQALRALTRALGTLHGPVYALYLAHDRQRGVFRSTAFVGPEGPVFARLRKAGFAVPPTLPDGPLTLPATRSANGSGAPVVSGALAGMLSSACGYEWCVGVEAELAIVDTAAAPIQAHHAVTGLLIMMAGEEWPENLLRAAAAHGAVAISNVQERIQLQRAAEIDPETLVRSNRHLREAAGREIFRAGRYKHGLSVVAVEHLEGASHNPSLRGLAATLTRTVRRSDTVGRLSDTRLALLLPETGASGAGRVVARLLEQAAEDGHPVRAGAATFPEDGAIWADLVASAESRLSANAPSMPRVESIDLTEGAAPVPLHVARAS